VAARGTKTSGGLTDKVDMTIANSSVEGIHKAESLLSYASNRIASKTGTGASAYDSVSLSDTAVSMVEAKVAMAANVSVVHAADEMRKTLLNLVG